MANHADKPAYSIKDACALENRSIRVRALAGGGKTTMAVAKALDCAAAGKSVTVVVASSQAALTVRELLRKGAAELAAQDVLNAVAVRTPSQLCLEVMGCEDGAPVVLTAPEQQLLLADLVCATGMDSAAVKADFALAQKRWTTLTWDDAHELPSQQFADALKEQLDRLGAILRSQLSFVAVEHAREEASFQGARSVVIVDDAQCMSAATIELCRMLSAQQLLLLGDEAAVLELNDACPDPSAFAQFEADADVVLEPNPQQPASIRRFLEEVRSVLGAQPLGTELDPLMPQARGALQDSALISVKWRNPADEALGIARLSRRLCARDNVDGLEFVHVAVPGRNWARQIRKALQSRGVDGLFVSTGADSLRAALASPKLMAASPAHAYALLLLARNRACVSAWRLWFALGSEKRGCSPWLALCVHAAENGMSVVEALDQLAGQEGKFPAAFGNLPELYREGCKRADRIAQLKGLSLVRVLTEYGGGDAAAWLVADVDAQDDACTLAARMVQEASDPCAEPSSVAVRMSSLGNCQGTAPQALVVSLFNEGAYAGKSADVLADKRLLGQLYVACGTASQRVVLSFCQKAPEDLAGKLRLSAGRFRMENGQRVAMLNRVQALAQLGDAIPGNVSGEQLLSSF